MIRKVVIWLAITLAMLEVGLRLGGFYNTYTESIGQGYKSYYNSSHVTWYLSYPPNHDFELNHGDFKYQYHTSSLGLRSPEFSVPATDSVKRVFTLGDSFTEGVGAPSDSSWPALLQADFAKQGRFFKVYNAGVSGSDPFYEYTFLRDKLLKFKPDFIVMAINSSDFTDYLFRGGFERFRPDSTTTYRKGPWFEKLWQHSRIVRMFMLLALKYENSNLFVSKDNQKAEYANAALAIISACDSLNELARTNNAQFAVVLHPGPAEVVNKSDTVGFGPWKWHYVDFSNKIIGESFTIIDTTLVRRKIPVVNLWNSFDSIINRKNYLQYTYEHDKHFNSAGYKAMEEFVMNGLNKQQYFEHK